MTRDAGPPVAVIIGVHREELAFGERVAEGLDPRRISVLRIPEGISGRRPRADERLRYDASHREMYLQLLPLLKGRYRPIARASGAAAAHESPPPRRG